MCCYNKTSIKFKSKWTWINCQHILTNVFWYLSSGMVLLNGIYIFCIHTDDEQRVVFFYWVTFQDCAVSSPMTLTGNSSTHQLCAVCSSKEIVPIKVILPVIG